MPVIRRKNVKET